MQSKKTPRKEKSRPKNVSSSPIAKCSICGRPSNNYRQLVLLEEPSKPNICNDCLELFLEIVLEEKYLEWIHRISVIITKATEENMKPFMKIIKPKAKKGRKKIG